jgi:hypothetical protein
MVNSAPRPAGRWRPAARRLEVVEELLGAGRLRRTAGGSARPSVSTLYQRCGTFANRQERAGVLDFPLRYWAQDERARPWLLVVRHCKVGSMIVDIVTPPLGLQSGLNRAQRRIGRASRRAARLARWQTRAGGSARRLAPIRPSA